MNTTEITLDEGWEVVPSDDMAETPVIIRHDGRAVASIRFVPQALAPSTGEGSYVTSRFEWQLLDWPIVGREAGYEDALRAAVWAVQS
jgi:hypothetical protein